MGVYIYFPYSFARIIHAKRFQVIYRTMVLWRQLCRRQHKGSPTDLACLTTAIRFLHASVAWNFVFSGHGSF